LLEPGKAVRAIRNASPKGMLQCFALSIAHYGGCGNALQTTLSKRFQKAIIFSFLNIFQALANLQRPYFLQMALYGQTYVFEQTFYFFEKNTCIFNLFMVIFVLEVRKKYGPKTSKAMRQDLHAVKNLFEHGIQVLELRHLLHEGMPYGSG
jgi:hypothetical protein